MLFIQAKSYSFKGRQNARSRHPSNFDQKEFFNPKFSVLQIRQNKDAFVIGIEFQCDFGVQIRIVIQSLASIRIKLW